MKDPFLVGNNTIDRGHAKLEGTKEWIVPFNITRMYDINIGGGNQYC